MTTESSGAAGLHGNPKKILLVEKNRDARNQRARLLGGFGYAVHAAQDCDEAHLLWRNILPDLVLVAADQHSEARTFYEAIKQLNSRQQIAFLHSDSVYLCPVLNEGDLSGRTAVSRSFLESLEALLA